MFTKIINVKFYLDEPDKRRVKKWMNLLQRQQKKQRHMQKVYRSHYHKLYLLNGN